MILTDFETHYGIVYDNINSAPKKEYPNIGHTIWVDEALVDIPIGIYTVKSYLKILKKYEEKPIPVIKITIASEKEEHVIEYGKLYPVLRKERSFFQKLFGK